MKIYAIDLIDEFLIQKNGNEGLSPNTIDTYIYTFNLLLTCNYININNLETFTELNFKKFLLESFYKYKWSSYSYNQKRKNLKVFCSFLIQKGLITKNPFTNIEKRKEPNSLPKFLNTQQISTLLNIIENEFSGDSFLHIRNKTIFHFFLFTGLRLSELTNLLVQDINFHDYQIIVRAGKGNKSRLIPLINNLCITLQDYLKIRNQHFKNKKCDSLFLSKGGITLKKMRIEEIFRKLQKKLPFKLTPHMLRHTFATELVRKDINLYKISRILGHTDTKTTQIYLGLDIKNLCEDLNEKKLYVY